MTEPNLPAGGWTLAEAAAALLPELYAAAAKPPPKDWWMAGGAEAHKKERDAFRLAFSRLMEGGGYAADGVAEGDTGPSAISPQVWRAAHFQLGFPGEPNLPAELVGSGRRWRGIRVSVARGDVGEKRATIRDTAEAGAWWTSEQTLAWLAFGRATTWQDARESRNAPDDEAALDLLRETQLRISAAIASRTLPAWGQETADIAKAPWRDTLVPIPPEDFAGPSALTVQMNGWAYPPPMNRRYEGRWWQGMRFEAAAVQAAFRAAPGPAEPAPAVPSPPEPVIAAESLSPRANAGQAYSPEALAAWFLLRVRTWPKGKPPPTEAECIAAAQNYFADAPGRDLIRPIRQKKTPDDWRKRGPKPRR